MAQLSDFYWICELYNEPETIDRRRSMMSLLGQTQFSTLIPFMRLNSRILLVTMISPWLRA